MHTSPLGATGLQVTRLGYGSMGLRGPRTWGVRVVEDRDAETMLNRVLDAGINFIDTAPDYGVAEERIGRFLSHRRDEFILATKCGCDYVQHENELEVHHTFTADVVRQNLETSLRRLRTDHVDLMQFHGGTYQALIEQGLIDVLKAFQAEGKVRKIGVSSSLPKLSELIDAQAFDTFQIPYSCVEPDHRDEITRAGQQGAGVIVRGGIGKGGPDAEIQREKLNQVWKTAGLDELRDNDMSPAEFILRYTLSHPYCHTTIVGTCNPDHFAENVRSAEKGPLPADTVAEVGRRVDAARAKLE